MSLQQRVDTDLDALVEKLPPQVLRSLEERGDLTDLLEVVLDLGHTPEARFPDESIVLSSQEITQDDLRHVIERIGPFGDDNRAGIERTLHRISAVRNRTGKTVGLTLRVGRAVYGTIRIIEDLILTGKSVLLLGKPGVGKTTMLREVARVLADDAKKRVIVVDTSNEIAGDGDIPHPSIGRARRMQVATPALQHAVMIEAVENHMPEVIIIDEIGTELDANAARTIAERGVQLVATAHGNTLENLIANPTLSDLVGGIHTVTLGDEEARRRRTQKTVLERRAPPTFDILVEIQGWNQVAIHPNVAETVDRVLRGFPITPETRAIDEKGEIGRFDAQPELARTLENGGLVWRGGPSPSAEQELTPGERATHIMPYGVNKGKLQQAVRGANAPVELVEDIEDADILVTTKNYYRRKTQALLTAEEKGKPIHVLRRNTLPQIEQFIRTLFRRRPQPPPDVMVTAMREAEEAVAQIHRGRPEMELNPQGAFIRHVQHQIAETYGLVSSSSGKEPDRYVVIYRRWVGKKAARSDGPVRHFRRGRGRREGAPGHGVKTQAD